MTRLALLKVINTLINNYLIINDMIQMYNQSTGMGGEHGPRPPMSLPNMPLPPDLPGLHQDKAMNLHVERQRALEEMRRKEEDNMMKLDQDRKEMEERELERERHIRREMELKRDRLSEREEGSEEGVSPPPSKRHAADDDEEEDEVTALTEKRDANSNKEIIHNSIPGTNIKITTRGQ